MFTAALNVDSAISSLKLALPSGKFKTFHLCSATLTATTSFVRRGSNSCWLPVRLYNALTRRICPLHPLTSVDSRMLGCHWRYCWRDAVRHDVFCRGRLERSVTLLYSASDVAYVLKPTSSRLHGDALCWTCATHCCGLLGTHRRKPHTFHVHVWRPESSQVVWAAC